MRLRPPQLTAAPPHPPHTLQCFAVGVVAGAPCQSNVVHHDEGVRGLVGASPHATVLLRAGGVGEEIGAAFDEARNSGRSLRW